VGAAVVGALVGLSEFGVAVTGALVAAMVHARGHTRAWV